MLRKVISAAGLLGPGLLVVMTWLGPGDILETSIAGGSYGYALVWALAVAILARLVLALTIGKYQLCNAQAANGEGVLDGYRRLHRLCTPIIGGAAVVMMHAYCSYMTVGLAEIAVLSVGFGQKWAWGLVFVVVAAITIIKFKYETLELIYKAFAAILTMSLIGLAVWTRPAVSDVVVGLMSFEMPTSEGRFGGALIVLSMVGAVAGSIMNLIYPYALAEKGWSGVKYRRIQIGDLVFSMLLLFLLDLAVWIVGAELLNHADRQIKTFADLADIVRHSLGRSALAILLFSMLILVFDSLVGFARGLSFLATHALLLSTTPAGGSKPTIAAITESRWRVRLAILGLGTSLVWTIPGMPGFVPMTLFVNAIQVVLLPGIAVGLWVMTSRKSLMLPGYANRWWEHLILGALTALACWGAVASFRTVISAL